VESRGPGEVGLASERVSASFRSDEAAYRELRAIANNRRMPFIAGLKRIRERRKSREEVKRTFSTLWGAESAKHNQKREG